MKSSYLKYLYIMLITYMVMAFVWWSVLLQRYNFENSQLKLELTEYQIKHGDPLIHGDSVFIEDRYKSKTSQILGEAAVFGLILIAGLYFLYKASRKELQAARKERNFLMSITHELKSPLTSINLILETFIKRDLPAPMIKEFSQDAISESKRLEDLFDKMLTAAKLGETYNYHFENNSLSDLVSNVVQQFERSHNIEIGSNIQDDIMFKFDHDAMISIMMNLLENAVKYSNKKEVVIHVSLIESNKSIQLSIADQGVGISDSEKKKVLDQFYRVGSEDTRKAKGTGLGLYIVNKMVLAHKGKMKILDNKPKGTIFQINLNQK